MSLFEPIEVTWKGEEKTVQPDGVMRVLATLEDHLTFVEANDLVAQAINKGVRKQVKVSTAYAAFLKACGYRVTAGDVMETLDFSAYVATLIEIANVLKLTLAPDERKRYEALVAGAEDDEPKKKAPAKKPKAARSSQGKPTTP